MRLHSSIAPFITILFLYGGVLACQCTDPFRTPYEEFNDSTAVFVGVVSGHTDNIIDAPNHVVERTFQFKVEETLKGENLRNREVTTGITRDICYVGFGAVGSRSLVYAYGRRGKLHAYLFCSQRSMAVDLHFLRGRQRNVKEPRIYGVINREKLGESSRWPLQIRAVDESIGRKTLTNADKSGRFAFADLQDGVYLVRIERPDASSNEEYRIRLGNVNKFDEFPHPKQSVFLSFPIR